METNEISRHEVAVYRVLTGHPGERLTNEAIAAAAPDVKPRTVRAHTRRLAELGIVDVAEVFPGHRYRYSEKASKRNRAYLLRLEKAAGVFGFGT